MTNPTIALISMVTQQAKRRFIQKTHHVAQSQAAFLQTLLHHQRSTELAQALESDTIRSVDQFRDCVPVAPYHTYQPYFERVAAGALGVVTPDPVTYINMTSGSTGKQKLIPVTKRSRRLVAKANMSSMGFGIASAQQRRLPLGKLLPTGSARTFGHTAGGIPFGPVSAGDLRMGNLLYRQVFAHPFDVLQIPDSGARQYVALLHALRDPNLRVIGANFPIFAIKLGQQLETYAESLLDDLERGAIADWLPLDPMLRRRLDRQLVADPARARELRLRLASAGRLTPKLAWPALSFIITARGGTSSFYFEQFPDYFGDVAVFGGVYASAEATFGVYHSLDQDGAVLALDSGFFEFVPQSQGSAAQPQTLLPTEVTVGDRYRILVTNYNGLYRYDNGDVVEVLGFYNQAPIITFCHRRGGLLSSTTEKTTEHHTTQVMQQLQREFDLPLVNYCITLAEREVPPPYLLNIELSGDRTLQNPQRFLARFDAILSDVNASYHYKRQDAVPPPRLRILAPGSFAALQQRLVNQGMTEVQLKQPHISEDRQFLAGLKVVQEVQLEPCLPPTLAYP